jgi:hypothetical protein
LQETARVYAYGHYFFKAAIAILGLHGGCNPARNEPIMSCQSSAERLDLTSITHLAVRFQNVSDQLFWKSLDHTVMFIDPGHYL